MKWVLPFLLIAGLVTVIVACGDEETALNGSTADPANSPEQTLDPSPTAAAAPAPSRIFFQRETELWSVSPDGSDPLLLSAESVGSSGSWLYGNATPIGSPAGDRVAFVADSNLWIVDSVGANLRQLSDEGHPEDDRYTASSVFTSGWSPDGTKVLYYVESLENLEDQPDKEVRPEKGFYVVDSGSGRKTRLADLPNFVGWSEGSNAIVYESSYDSGSSRDWYELDLATQASRMLTAEPFDCSNVQPSFPLTSSKLLYACGDSSLTESSLVLATPENTDRRVLLQGKWAALQFPIFSPGGDAFVYQHQSEVMESGKVIFDLQYFDFHNGQTTQLASGCVRSKGWLDDATLLFLKDEDESCSDKATLYKVDVETGALTKLAEGVDWS